MDKLRKWFNKPKKEAENQPWVQASTSERPHDPRHGDTVHISSAPERTVAPRMDLRENLQEDFGQEQEVSDDQTVSRPLQTTDPQHSAEPPVCSSQVKVTNPTGGSRLPCSLPCSPMLRRRHWRSSSSSSSSLSRLWVEEALQRSKNLRQNEPRPPPPCFTEVKPEEERVTTAEEGEQDRWRDGSEGYEQVKTENAVGIRPPDTITFKPMTPSSLGVQERGEEEEEEDEEESQNLCLNLPTYCQLTPCVCDRCPSAPPFEAELVSGLQTFPLLSLEDFSHTLTQSSQWKDIQVPEGGSEQSVPRNRAPHPGKSSCLYPSLQRITPGLQNRKQEQEVDFIGSHLDYKPNKNCYHGNNTDNKLIWLSGAAGELQTFCCQDLRLIPKMLFDCSTCIQRTVFSVERCSFCSNKLRNTTNNTNPNN